MDWLKDFLTPVVTTGVWGLVVYLLGREGVKRFESAINRAFDRLKKAGPAEFEPLPRPSQLEATVEITEAGSSTAVASAAPDSLQARFETGVRAEMEKANPPDQVADLVRMVASIRIAWVFEAINNVVLGSQIQLLQSLNSGPVPIAKAREFYDLAASAFPVYYQTYPFEGWLNWLVATAHLADQLADTLMITEEGREFLRYLIARGYTFTRFG